MIQLNLLPQVKVDYIKGQHVKRLVMGISLVATAVSVGLVIIMFSLVAIQKKHVSDLDKDIDKLTTELKSTPDLDKILAVQSQLNVLPSLYDGRPAVDRLPTYLDQTTPTGVRINKIVVDYTLSTIVIEGKADTLELVNSYTDTLKFTTYKVGEEASLQAFKDVVLLEFGRDEKEATYTISFGFDTTIFDITKTVNLVVPSLVTTRANAPGTDLFFIETDSTEGEE
jgi:hypothetical protein